MKRTYFSARSIYQKQTFGPKLPKYECRIKVDPLELTGTSWKPMNIPFRNVRRREKSFILELATVGAAFATPGYAHLIACTWFGHMIINRAEIDLDRETCAFLIALNTLFAGVNKIDQFIAKPKIMDYMQRTYGIYLSDIQYRTMLRNLEKWKVIKIRNGMIVVVESISMDLTRINMFL